MSQYPSKRPGHWYVNHQDEVCVQDCPESAGGACGGKVPTWNELFKTSEECCENRLSWIATSYCEAQSELRTPPGTSKWYVDYVNEKCVQDCDSAAGVTCGGIVESAHVTLYESSDRCCSESLGWVPSKECEADATHTLDTSSGGTNKWYVNYRFSRCVQDCVGGAPCGGLAKSWDETFGSSGECCKEKLSWVSQKSCVVA